MKIPRLKAVIMTKKLMINLIWVKGLTLALIISVRGTPIVGRNTSLTSIDKNFVLQNVITNPKISESGKIVSPRNYLICEHFELPCTDSDKNKCGKNKTCAGEDDSCYTTWKLTNVVSDDVDSLNGTTNIETQSVFEVQKMGCMPTDHTVHQCQTTCVNAKEQIPKHGILHCCCTENYCNSEFIYNPVKTNVSKPTAIPPVTVTGTQTKDAPVPLIVGVVVIIIVLAVGASVAYVVHKRKIPRPFGSLPQQDVEVGLGRAMNLTQNQNSLVPLREIALQEIKARGRFGAVWKGTMTYHDTESNEEVRKTVAVKIFPMQDKNSWQAEQEIYNLPRMDHDSILKFIQCERRGENLAMEYWLTSEFHDNGSLCDFLKSHMVSWGDLCKIARTMAAGLTHLHEELARSGTLDMKPAIAHRDFKSKNVLIKSDLTACLADFGLALIFEPGKSCGDTHGQVGTRRYMAPEVLEGAINFSRDAFLRIDMYACGLVLWELVSRCTALPITSTNSSIPNPTNLNTHSTLTANPGGVGNSISHGTNEYKLPFEAEVSNPTLIEMQELVVSKKARPIIKDSWRQHQGINALCNTIEECWDQDAEARVSASCVMERIKSFQHLSNPQSVNEDPFVSNSTSEHFTPPRLPRSATVISPTDQRMNAENDQQTAEAAALILNPSSCSPNSSTSPTCNNYNASANRNVHQSVCNNQTSAAEETPLLNIQPGNHTNNTSNNNNLTRNRGLLSGGQNIESFNIPEEPEGSNITANVIT